MVLRVALFAILAVPSAAFQGPIAARSSATTKMLAEKSAALPFLPKPQALDGSMVGDVGFDPLGFSQWLPMDYAREAELKHGRICMLAVTGFAATDIGFRLPGEQFNFASIDAHNVAVASGYMTVMGCAILAIESLSILGNVEMLNGSGRVPGDFGFDPWKLEEKPDKMLDMKLKEITHCRLAMLAFGGMVTQAVLTQKGFPYY